MYLYVYIDCCTYRLYRYMYIAIGAINMNGIQYISGMQGYPQKMRLLIDFFPYIVIC